MAKIDVLYSNEHLQLDKLDENQYRLTLFNDENHWAGEMYFSNKGISFNDIDNIY